MEQMAEPDHTFVYGITLGKHKPTTQVAVARHGREKQRHRRDHKLTSSAATVCHLRIILSSHNPGADMNVCESADLRHGMMEGFGWIWCLGCLLKF